MPLSVSSITLALETGLQVVHRPSSCSKKAVRRQLQHTCTIPLLHGVRRLMSALVGSRCRSPVAGGSPRALAKAGAASFNALRQRMTAAPLRTPPASPARQARVVTSQSL
jgi:hypothetical protein